jgi:hypothetical protein
MIYDGPETDTKMTNLLYAAVERNGASKLLEWLAMNDYLITKDGRPISFGIIWLEWKAARREQRREHKDYDSS